MSLIYINLFHQRDQGQLNPSAAIIQLHEQFPEAIVLPEDQLTLAAKRAEKLLDQTQAANRSVVAKLWQDAQLLGPAYAFYIPAEGEQPIQGVIKRYQADFYGDTSFSEAMRTRIVAFLRSLIPKGMTVQVCEEMDDEGAVVEQH